MVATITAISPSSWTSIGGIVALIAAPRLAALARGTKCSGDNQRMRRHRSKFSAAVLVILRERDRICVIRRDATGFLDGHYTLPGGVVEEGETLREAACREAREEAGVELTSEGLRHVHVLHSRNDGESWFGHFFIAEGWSGTPRIAEAHKHSDMKWVPIDRLPSPMVPYVGTALQAISLGQPYSEFGWNQ